MNHGKTQKEVRNGRRALFAATTALVTTTPALAMAGGGGSIGVTAAFHAVNLVVLVGAIIYFARGPVRNMLAERKKQVTADLEEAKRLREEAREMLSKYEAKLSGLDAECNKIVAEYEEMGKSERDRIIKDAKRQAEKIKADAELTIKNDIRNAREALESEMVQLAADLAEKQLRASLDDKAQANLFDGFLADIERQAQN